MMGGVSLARRGRLCDVIINAEIFEIGSTQWVEKKKCVERFVYRERLYYVN
jgi:hypothetical protein